MFPVNACGTASSTLFNYKYPRNIFLQIFKHFCCIVSEKNFLNIVDTIPYFIFIFQVIMKERERHRHGE